MRKINLKKQKSFIVFLIVIVLVLFTACSEKEKTTLTPDTATPPVMASTPDFVITMPAEDTVFPDSVITEISYSGSLTPAVKLDFFIKKSITDSLALTNKESRKLFAYHIIATDLFTPRNRGLDDLTWDIFAEGYLLPEKSYRTFFEELSNQEINTYNVKNVRNIELFRSIIVEKPDGTKVLFENNIFSTEMIANHSDDLENAFKLKDLITEYITKTPENYTYLFTAVDDFTMEYEWSHIQAGYWLKQSERTIFPTMPDLPNNMIRFKNLMKISLISR